jgi:hypothetical protein
MARDLTDVEAAYIRLILKGSTLLKIQHACGTKGFTFKAQNGLSATIYQFNSKKLSRKAAKVFGQACFQSDTPPITPILGRCVVKFSVENNPVYVVCMSGWKPEAIINRYQINIHDGLYASGLFVVFKDQVYRWSSRTGELLINAVINRVNPAIAALVTLP